MTSPGTPRVRRAELKTSKALNPHAQRVEGVVFAAQNLCYVHSIALGFGV